MKRFLSAAFFVGLQMFTLYSLGYAQATTFHAKDAFARTEFFINGAVNDLSVFSGPNGTFLDYGSFMSNPDGSFTFTNGHGIIPNSAFQANSLQNTVLDVDTSQVSGFHATSCTITFFPRFTETCTDGTPEGPIHVEWDPNGGFSRSEVEHLTSTSGPFTKRLDFNSDVDSADATGTFIGASFTDPGRALTGKAHDSSISIIRGN